MVVIVINDDVFVFVIRRQPSSKRTDKLFPHTKLFRSDGPLTVAGGQAGLAEPDAVPGQAHADGGLVEADIRGQLGGDRKSVVEGKSVSVRVDLGGRRCIKKKKKYKEVHYMYILSQ